MPEDTGNETLVKELQKQIGVLRAEKFNLEKELEAASEKNRILGSENRSLADAVSAAKAEKEELASRIQSLEKAQTSLSGENQRLKTAVAGLEEERAEAQARIGVLEGEVSRPKLRPEDLSGSFKEALARMEEGLKTPEGRVDYTVGSLEADIKATLSVDEKNNLYVKLPYLGESVRPENFSFLKFSLQAVPKARLPLVQVPQLAGLSREGAGRALAELGLKGEIQEKPSPTPPGYVISQNPEAYTEVPPGSKVALTVSAAERVKVPDLLNLAKEMALRVLLEAGLEAGKVESKFSEAAPDTVLGQSPKAGTEAERGSAVDLSVSAPGVKVPALKGKAEKEAREILAGLGLKAGKVEYKKSSFAEDRVLSQSPEAGKTVLPGSAVNLVVSSRMEFEEFKETVRTHRSALRHGPLLTKVFSSLEKLQVRDAEGLRELLEKGDTELQSLLGLRARGEAAAAKKIFQRVFEEYP